MSYKEANLKTIQYLSNKGVDVGTAENVTKDTINRNYTLDSELTACGILLNSFDPNVHDVSILNSSDEASRIDINIDGNYLFQVKRMVISKVQSIILDMHSFYHNSIKMDNRYVQAIVTYNYLTGLDDIKENDIKITKTEGITGAEILIDSSMFNELIAQKILNIYNKVKNKERIIPIIDVRHLEVPDYDYIKRKISQYYFEKGYIILFLTLTDDKRPTPTLFPMYHPMEKYEELMKKLRPSLSGDIMINTYSCSWSHKKTFNDGEWHGWIERDDEGYLIIDGIKICKSLTYGKEMVFFGVQSQKKIVSNIALDINGERTEIDIEYLKAPKRRG